MAVLACCRHLFMAAVFLLILTVQLPCAHARDGNSKPLELFEEKIKAGLVYNFLKYTTWPSFPDGKGTVRVCLFGADPFNGYLSPLQGRYAQQFVIDVIEVQEITETQDCNLVFISGSRKTAMSDVLEFVKDKPVLTVSDIEDFADRGGMVELVKEDQRVTFYINKKAVFRAGLDIQDRLLKVARRVSG